MPKIITNYIPLFESESNDNMPRPVDVYDEYGRWIGFKFIKNGWRTE